MIKTIYFLIAQLLLSAITIHSHGQELTWTGLDNNDFFNEANWVVSGTESAPAAGSVDPNVPIAFNLLIKDAAEEIEGQGYIALSSVEMEMTLDNSNVNVDGLTSGKVVLKDEATLILKDNEPLGDQAVIDFIDPISWLKLIEVNPDTVINKYLSQFTSHGGIIKLDTNLRVNQYYFNGSIIRRIDSQYSVLTLFDGQNQTGDSFGVKEFVVFDDDSLGAFNNKASSILLERGYMVVLAIYQNGTGKRQCYIASETPLQLDLPVALNNTVSFIRVVPWNWVNKKGVSGFKQGLDASWTYNWGAGEQSRPNMEYAPMSWGYGGANLSNVIGYRDMKNVTHLLGFNESDNCNDQSGQFSNLCQISVAVPQFGRLQRSGLRLSSPNGREEAPFGWLNNFRAEAIKQDISFDVVGVHWYDWGSGPANSPNADPEVIFNRFKNYLQRVYDSYQMPLWITEFNANPWRSADIQLEFLKLALPYLDSIEYVERYDYFVPSTREGVEETMFFDTLGNITEIGEFYRDHVSSPSIPEDTWVQQTMLRDMDKKIEVSLKLEKDTLNEGEFMTIKAVAQKNLGAPQQITLSIGIDESQYTIGSSVLIIEEGASEAQTIIQIIDDDLVEDTVVVQVIAELEEGAIVNIKDASFVMTSDDKEVLSYHNSEKNIAVFPNPASTLLQLGSDFNGEISKIYCYSLTGTSLKVEIDSQGMINISHLPSGIYFLELENRKSEKFRSKFIKK